MRTEKTITRSMCCAFCCLLAYTAGVFGSEDVRGAWTLNEGQTAGRVQLSLNATRNPNQPGGYSFNTSSEWSQTDLQGLDLATRSKHDVHFIVRRDAGTIEGEGFVKEGEGAGLFTFRPDGKYSGEMAGLGFSGVNEERQLAFALQDVSLQFARDMKATGIQGLSADKLLACRVHGVSPAFIREIRAAGIEISETDKLIAFRIHGVTPEYVRTFERLGYGHPPADQLIAMRIHGVTPEYVEKLKARGVQKLTLEQLVRMRIFGID